MTYQGTSQRPEPQKLWREGEQSTVDTANGPDAGNHCWFQERVVVKWDRRKPGMHSWRSEYKMSKGRRETKDGRWRKLMGIRSWERLYGTLLGRFRKTKVRATLALVGVLMGVHFLYTAP